MQSEILVPLDGSPLAEAVLPEAIMLAQATASSLTLLQVVGLPLTIEAAIWVALSSAGETEVGDSAAYLEGIAARLREQGLTVATKTALSDPAAAILRYASESSTLLLTAMATHGRSGFTHWLLGSVAEKVTQGSHKPLLLLRPPQNAAPTTFAPAPPCRRILLPLDGSPLAEQALSPACQLARACGASLLLLLALPAPDGSPYLPDDEALSHYGTALATARSRALEYLGEIARRADAAGIAATGRVVYGRPAEAILAVAASEGADLIAMATHGRGGLAQFWLGSVARKVVQRATTPLLLIRPPAPGAEVAADHTATGVAQQ